MMTIDMATKISVDSSKARFAAMKMFAAADSVAGYIGMINVCSSFDKQPDN